MKTLITFGWLFLTCWCVVVIGGLWPQVQMAATDGNILVPSFGWKVLAVAILLGAATRQSSRLAGVGPQLALPLQLILTWAVWAFYLVVTLLVHVIFLDLSLLYVLFSFNAYYFFLLLIVPAFLLRGLLDERTVLAAGTGVAAPLLVLGIGQHLLGDPLLPTASNDGSYRVMSLWFADGVRGFSLFPSPLWLGQVAVFTVAASIASLALRGASVTGIGMMVLGTAAAYSTLTRVVYLQLFCILVTLSAVSIGCRPRLTRWLPLLFMCLAALLIAFITIFGPGVESLLHRPIFGLESFYIRLDQGWSKAVSLEWAAGDPLRLLFGCGLIQNRRFEITRAFYVDNSFLAVMAHIGLVGLLIWGTLMWALWRWVMSELTHRHTVLALAIVSFWSSWMLVGLFNNIAIMVFPAACIPLVLTRPTHAQPS